MRMYVCMCVCATQLYVGPPGTATKTISFILCMQARVASIDMLTQRGAETEVSLGPWSCQREPHREGAGGRLHEKARNLKVPVKGSII